ncbi:MAG: ABC transporter substrate-binding protein [Rhizobiaceae bacterium]|nr:ABC transporter substrate-binding protein [Rhizobiaceae bacterium]
MLQRFSARGLRVLFLATSVAVGSAASATATETAVLPNSSRIVSIGGAITEIIFALGDGGKLVARDSTSIYPEAALELPDVGYMRQLSPEGVLSVNPTGILALQGSGPREAVDVLKKTDVPYVEIEEDWDRAGIVARILAVGMAIGAPDRAEMLASEVERKLSEVVRLTSAIQEKKRVLFVLSTQGGKIQAAGANTAANGIIELAGATNAIEGVDGYKQLADEAVIEANPDFILMMTRVGEHGASDDELFANPAIAATTAGAEKHLIKMDGAYLLGFGPRTVDAVKELSERLYGDRISD